MPLPYTCASAKPHGTPQILIPPPRLPNKPVILTHIYKSVQERLGRRLERIGKTVPSGYCRLYMPLVERWGKGERARPWAGMHCREAVTQAVGGGCQSGWGRLLSVTNAIEPWRQGDSGWA
jgi:hypothetical protein